MLSGRFHSVIALHMQVVSAPGVGLGHRQCDTQLPIADDQCLNEDLQFPLSRLINEGKDASKEDLVVPSITTDERGQVFPSITLD